MRTLKLLGLTGRAYTKAKTKARTKMLNSETPDLSPENLALLLELQAKLDAQLPAIQAMRQKLNAAIEALNLVQDPEDIKAHDSMNKTLGADEQDDRHGVYNPEAEFDRSTEHLFCVHGKKISKKQCKACFDDWITSPSPEAEFEAKRDQEETARRRAPRAQ